MPKIQNTNTRLTLKRAVYILYLRYGGAHMDQDENLYQKVIEDYRITNSVKKTAQNVACKSSEDTDN